MKQEHTTGELVTLMSEQVSLLIRDELKLARLEMGRKGKQAAIGAGMFGTSGLVAAYGVGCLLACTRRLRRYPRKRSPASRPTSARSRRVRTDDGSRTPAGD
jgi:hypothetical protein